MASVSKLAEYRHIILGRIVAAHKPFIDLFLALFQTHTGLPRLVPCCDVHDNGLDDTCRRYTDGLRATKDYFRTSMAPPQWPQWWWNPLYIPSAIKQRQAYRRRIAALVECYARWNVAMMLLQTSERDLKLLTVVEPGGGGGTNVADTPPQQLPYQRKKHMPNSVGECSFLFRMHVDRLAQSYTELVRDLGLPDHATPDTVRLILEDLYPPTPPHSQSSDVAGIVVSPSLSQPRECDRGGGIEKKE